MMDSTLTRDPLLLLLEELYAFVNQLDELKSNANAQALARRAEALKARMVRAKEALPALAAENLRTAFDTLQTNIQQAQTQLSNQPKLERIKELRVRLAENYEGVLAAARRQPSLKDLTARLSSLRPKNYTRNIFHVAMATTSLLCHHFLLGNSGSLIVLGVLLAIWVAIDIGRRMSPSFSDFVYDRLLKGITRPRERYIIPAATWYTVGLFIAVLISNPVHAQLACIVLGFGDPVASLAGKRWGKKKLWRRKSWAGTLAFITVSGGLCVAWLTAAHSMDLGSALAWGGLAATAGAIAELFSDDRLDDNLTIPIGTALALFVAALWIG